MKKLQSLKSPLFRSMEAEEMKKIQGGFFPVGTWTEREVKITSGHQGQDDSSSSDPEAPAHDDGKDSGS